MGKIKVIAVDIDGTLTSRETGKVVASNGEAVRRAVAAGVNVVLTSARLYRSASGFADEMEIPRSIISCCGAVVRLPGLEEIWHQRIALEVARQIASYADERAYELLTTGGDLTYLRQRSGQALGVWTNDRHIVESNLAALTSEPTRILGPGKEAGAEIAKLAKAAFPAEVRVYEDYLVGELASITMVHERASKGRALTEVLGRLGIAPDEALAIGDGEADIDMFGVAGLSVAVGGSPDNVVEAADVIGPRCEEGAVAWAVEEFVL